MRMILRFLKPYKRDLVLAPACKLLEAIFELIVPLVMAKMIDVGIANRDAGYAWKMCGVMLLLGVCGLTFSLICQYRAAVCAFHFGADLRRGLYQHINRLSYAELDRLGTASLGTHLTSDTTAVQTGVNMFIRLAVRAPFLVIGAMIMAFLLDVRLSLIFLIVVPLIAAILYTVIRKTIPMFSQIQKKLERIFRLTGENLEACAYSRFSQTARGEDE